MIRIAVLLVLFITFQPVISQPSMMDSSITIPYIGISYGYHVPKQDLAERFGSFSTIGGQFGIKMKSGLHLSMKIDYVFGEYVKEDVLKNLRTTEGGIIEIGGELSNPILDLEGYTVSVMGGYLFPVIGPNPNSGILVSGGFCFLQHRIQIDYRDGQIPQLEGDYIKGYDRLTNGFGFNEFIGYLHYGKRKLINIYAGVDLMQTFTSNKRGYNYDEGKEDHQKRKDHTIGFRLGWMLTLHRRAPQQYYYH